MWEDRLRTAVPYTPGEQPNVEDMIKLNTNENPYPPSEAVKRVIRNFDTDSLRLYPELTVNSLRQELSEYYNFSLDEVFVGVGSDDVLAMSFMAFFNGKGKLLFPDITYSFYDVWAELFGIKYETIPLDENFNINIDDYKRDNCGIILANPNAPTGNALGVDKIEALVKANRNSVVIVDEAYIDFGAVSALPLVKKYDNLAVVQTFSKSRSLAGIRIGFSVGSKRLTKALSDVKYSFNSYTLNNITIKAGIASIKDEAYFKTGVQKIISTRERSKARFEKLGFYFPDSMTNFIFVSHPEKSAVEISNYLRSKNIFVRHFDKPRIDNYLRITVGSDAEMDILFNELEKFL